MLTKQEREEIAERFRNYDKAEYVTLYSGMYDGLLGEHVPKETTVKKDRMELASRILELCDTSNMLELPVDKDGEYIRVGDTVYDCECTKYEVAGHSSSSNVLLSAGRELICFKKPANELTHKEPVTVKLLAQHIKRVLGDEATSIGVVPHLELRRIAKQLESLGDSDDD